MANTYSVGTVAVTNGSKTVTITGGLFISINVKPGDQIGIAGGLLNAIDTLTDATHLELVRPWEGATGAGLTYIVWHMPAGWGDRVELNEAVAENIRLLGQDIPFTAEQLAAANAAAADAEASMVSASQSEAYAEIAAGSAKTKASEASGFRDQAQVAAVAIQSANPSAVVGAASNQQALVGAALDKAMNPANTAYVIGYKLLDSYRSALWTLQGDGDPAFIPSKVTETNKVISSDSRTTGQVSLPTIDAAVLASYRSAIWTFSGDGDPAAVPSEVTETNKVLLARSAVDGSLVGIGTTTAIPEAMAYVAAGVLRIVGGAGGDRVLNSDAGKTWINAIPYSGSTLAVYTQGGTARLVRVSYIDGSIYPDGEVTLWTNDGQSNPEGQAGAGAAALRLIYPFADRLRMPNLGARLGLVTSGGTSLQLDPAGFTKFVPLADDLAPSGTHGTTSVASAAYHYAQDAADACAGWTPNMVVWGNAEGGQNIVNLLNTAPAGKYAFSNIVAALTKAISLLGPSQRLVYRWLMMAQVESNVDDAALGSKHELYRSQVYAAKVALDGQTEPLRMLTTQMSSFYDNSAGARSLLTYAMANQTPFGNFWCLGPTYNFPYDTDYLHHTSVGHDQRGELEAEAAKSVENTGAWVPLCMTAAHITNTNEITVTLSEAAVNDEAAGVAAIANKGIAVPGKTVASVAVAGASLIITLTGAAAGATVVQAAMTGHTSPTRTAATIPRSTIRSVASYGAYRSGAAIRKWLCHQEISIT